MTQMGVTQVRGNNLWGGGVMAHGERGNGPGGSGHALGGQGCGSGGREGW